nr:uncharacterized protein LOC129385548 [Dermacentor andersoni]
MDESSECFEIRNGSNNGRRTHVSASSTMMKVADNPAPGVSEQARDVRAGGDYRRIEYIELATGIARDNDSIVWDPKPCSCVADGPKCRSCLVAGKNAVKVKRESWSVEKTVIFGIILGAFFIWAVVFGICFNVFKL